MFTVSRRASEKVKAHAGSWGCLDEENITYNNYKIMRAVYILVMYF